MSVGFIDSSYTQQPALGVAVGTLLRGLYLRQSRPNPGRIVVEGGTDFHCFSLL